jgi:hypothetical protein
MVGDPAMGAGSSIWNESRAITIIKAVGSAEGGGRPATDGEIKRASLDDSRENAAE